MRFARCLAIAAVLFAPALFDSEPLTSAASTEIAVRSERVLMPARTLVTTASTIAIARNAHEESPLLARDVLLFVSRRNT